jgi:hypothetical protein
MTMALQIGGTTVVDNSRNLVNTSVDAARITSGTLATARLGSGTASSSTFLRGDQTWQTITSLAAASTAQAQAGTADNVAITPLKMRQGFNASGSAPVYACRAWVNFDGTTAGTNPAPMTIRGSGNVSSVTRNSLGNFTVNFTTAMPNAAYAVQCNHGNEGLITSASRQASPFVINAGNFSVATMEGGGSSRFFNNPIVVASVFC